MSEIPKVYPFRRSSGAATAGPVVRSRRAAQVRSFTFTRILTAIVIGVACFLLGRSQILGGLHPFGPAVVAAIAAVYPKKGALAAIPVLAGFYAGVSGRDFLVYTAVIILLTVVFLLYVVDAKKQWFVVPGMVLSAVLVSKGLLVALTTYTDYLMLVSVFESLIAAGLSLVCLVVVHTLRRVRATPRFAADETACAFLVMAGIICGLNGLSIGPVDLQSMASRLLVLFGAYLGGPGAGAAVGALVGIVPSLSAVVTPTTIASYCFSGLLAGIFSGFGRLGAVVGFLLGNLVLALYVASAVEISAGLLASAAAALIFLLIPVRSYQKIGRVFISSSLRSAKDERAEHLLRLAVRRLRDSSRAFNDLSGALAADVAQPAKEDANLRTAMEQLSHQLCSSCSLRDICWEIDYHETFRGILSLFETVREGGLATVKDAPENFGKRCPHIRELIAIVNSLYDLYCRSSYWQLQRESSRRLISTQLDGVSEVLSKIASEITEHGAERELLEREFQQALARRGMPVEAAGIGSMSRRAMDVWVEFYDCPGESFCRQAVEDETSRLLGCAFHVHERTCSSQGGCSGCGRCTFRLLAAGAHRFNVGRAQLAKDGCALCGDSAGSILLEEGKQLLLVSDGMGVGEHAAEESGEAITLISRLLTAGFSRDTAIDVVNAALSLRGSEESFVTLDLCVVDLYNGVADFIKTGGATSYIKRGGTVRVIKGSSLPVGMLYNVDREVTSEPVFPGDMIILASDGLLDMDFDEEGQWLSRVIGEAVANTPQALAEYLLDKVISVSNGKLKDDITVLVAQMGDVA